MPYKHPKTGAWYTDFRATDPKTGRRRRYRLSLGEARTLREAEAAERAIRVGVERERRVPGPVVQLATGRTALGTSGVPSPMAALNAVVSCAFSGLARMWLDTVVATKRKPSYYRSSESACAAWLVPHFGDREVSTITRLEVERLQASMRSTTKSTRSNRPPGPKTVNNVVGVLSSMLEAAVGWGYLEANPCADVEPLPTRSDRQGFAFYTASQSAAWLAKCAELEPAWYPLFLTGFRTGLRLGELFALERGDVDLVSGTLRVRQSVADHTDEVTAPKSGKSRTVDLSPQVVEVLRATRRVGVELVFADATGRRLNRDMLKHPWERVAAASGLPRIRPHDMRHSYASQLVIAGTPLKVVQEQLGHATIEMTMRYAHLAPGAARSFVAALDGLATPLATPSTGAIQSRRPKQTEEVEAAGVEPAERKRRW